MIPFIGSEGLKRNVRMQRRVSSGDYSGRLVSGGRAEFYLVEETGSSHRLEPDQPVTISYRDRPRSFRVRLPTNAQMVLF